MPAAWRSCRWSSSRRTWWTRRMRIGMIRRSSPWRSCGCSKRTAWSGRARGACSDRLHRPPDADLMLVASEVKGELARIVPARTCCRRAELVGLLYAGRARQGLRTLDHGTARIAVQLAGSLGLPVTAPKARGARGARPGRHHLVIDLDG